jgi:glucosamine kinase
MVLIADSGSSKTAWRLIDEKGGINQFITRGMNPVHLGKEDLCGIIRNELIEENDIKGEEITRIFFYGAGCIPGESSERMELVLKNVFMNADIEIADDMLAVARGVCGHAPGIACILGTGANSCLFDGTNITFKIPALGFILGDEGSGAWLGKEFLGAYIREELPGDLYQSFKKQYRLDRSAILNEVYRGDHPASFLASFSKFLFRHRAEQYVHRLVQRGFNSFLEKNVMRYPDYQSLPVHFSGSVAFYYSSILRQAASAKGIILKNIVEGPIAGLTLYHNQSEEK